MANGTLSPGNRRLDGQLWRPALARSIAPIRQRGAPAAPPRTTAPPPRGSPDAVDGHGEQRHAPGARRRRRARAADARTGRSTSLAPSPTMRLPRAASRMPRPASSTRSASRAHTGTPVSMRATRQASATTSIEHEPALDQPRHRHLLGRDAAHVRIQADLAKEGAEGLRDGLGAHRHHAPAPVAVGQVAQLGAQSGRAGPGARRDRDPAQAQAGELRRHQRVDEPGLRRRRGHRAQPADDPPAQQRLHVRRQRRRGLPAIADEALADHPAARRRARPWDRRPRRTARPRGRRCHRPPGSSSGVPGPAPRSPVCERADRPPRRTGATGSGRARVCSALTWRTH